MASVQMGIYGDDRMPGQISMEQTDGYAVSDISQRIYHCGDQVPPFVLAPPLPNRPIFSQNRTRLTLLVGLPGGGTTWFFQALVQGHGSRALNHSGFFHPYCHQLWRVELSHFVAATEDLSKIHLFREFVPEPLFDDLVQRMLRQALQDKYPHGNPGMFVTRENLNVWRTPDYVRNGFRAIGLFRHRKHTFPLTDSDESPTWEDLIGNMMGLNDYKYSTLCRTCFYFMMFFAPQLGTKGTMLTDTRIVLVARLASHAVVPLARQVAAHTLFWYVLLRLPRVRGYPFPVISYEVLIRNRPDVLRSLLRQSLPEGVDAAAVISAVVASRHGPSWLEARERRYAEAPGYAEAEHCVREMIELIRQVDPETNVDILG